MIESSGGLPCRRAVTAVARRTGRHMRGGLAGGSRAVVATRARALHHTAVIHLRAGKGRRRMAALTPIPRRDMRHRHRGGVLGKARSCRVARRALLGCPFELSVQVARLAALAGMLSCQRKTRLDVVGGAHRCRLRRCRQRHHPGAHNGQQPSHHAVSTAGKCKSVFHGVSNEVRGADACASTDPLRALRRRSIGVASEDWLRGRRALRQLSSTWHCSHRAPKAPS